MSGQRRVGQRAGRVVLVARVALVGRVAHPVEPLAFVVFDLLAGAVRLARRLDPDVGVHTAGRAGLRPLAEAGAGLVAPVTKVDAAVGTRLVHVGDRVGGRAGAGRPVRAAPPVARGVDDHADLVAHRGAQDRLVRPYVRQLVKVVVPVDPAAGDLADPLAAHHVIDAEVRLLQYSVVGHVGGEAVQVLARGRCGVHDLPDQVGERLEVVVPAEPAVVTDVHVVVHIRDRAERAERVRDAVDIDAAGQGLVALWRGGLPRRHIRDQVRQRVDLDHVHDPQVGVGRVTEDLGDPVDELRLVPVEVVEGQLAAGRHRGAVPAGQVVGDHLEQVGTLRQRLIEVRPQPSAGLRAIDRGDPVHPDERRLVGDGAAAARLSVRGPVRVHVRRGALERVGDPSQCRDVRVGLGSDQAQRAAEGERGSRG